MGWMDDLDEERKRNNVKAANKLDILGWSALKTPEMTHRLVNQVREDAEVASARLGVSAKVNLDSDRLHIYRDEYPTFFLQISIPDRVAVRADPVIVCHITSRKSTRAVQRKKTVSIQVLCVGPDECYFVIDGNDKCSEQQVSEALLKPLFHQALKE
jgi:hypothetical protein